MKAYPHFTRMYMGLIGAFSLIFWPSHVKAHLVTTGLGPVYDGIGHLVMTPKDLIPALAIALFAGLRALIAADLNLSPKSFTAVVVGVGFVHGVLNGVALKQGPGILAALFVIVAIVSAFIVSLKQHWARIVVRVAGSWVAAIGMLMFGWMMRSQG